MIINNTRGRGPREANPLAPTPPFPASRTVAGRVPRTSQRCSTSVGLRSRSNTTGAISSSERAGPSICVRAALGLGKCPAEGQLCYQNAIDFKNSSQSHGHPRGFGFSGCSPLCRRRALDADEHEHEHDVNVEETLSINLHRRPLYSDLTRNSPAPNPLPRARIRPSRSDSLSAVFIDLALPETSRSARLLIVDIYCSTLANCEALGSAGPAAGGCSRRTPERLVKAARPLSTTTDPQLQTSHLTS